MHLHRLTPSDLRFQLSERSVTKRKPGPIHDSTGIDFTKPLPPKRQLFIYFEDDGRAWIGEDEDNIRAIDEGWTTPIPKGAEFNIRDLANCFRLGMAVAHLNHTEFNRCPIGEQIPLELPDGIRPDTSDGV